MWRLWNSIFYYYVYRLKSVFHFNGQTIWVRTINRWRRFGMPHECKITVIKQHKRCEWRGAPCAFPSPPPLNVCAPPPPPRASVGISNRRNRTSSSTTTWCPPPITNGNLTGEACATQMTDRFKYVFNNTCRTEIDAIGPIKSGALYRRNDAWFNGVAAAGGGPLFLRLPPVTAFLKTVH